MTLSVIGVLRQSLRRLATGPALLVLLAFAVVQTIATFVPGQIVRVPAMFTAGGGAPAVMFTGNPLPVVALVVGAVISIYLSLVTIRVFAGQWAIVEREHLAHNVGFGLANLIGIAIVLGVILAVCFAVLVGLLGGIGILPWIVVFVLLLAWAFFAPAFVAVEDDNLLTAFRKSGRVLAENPLRVIALLIAIAIVNAVLQAVGSAVADALGSVAVVGLFVATVIAGIGSVFLWITVARAYDHLGVEPTA